MSSQEKSRRASKKRSACATEKSEEREFDGEVLFGVFAELGQEGAELRGRGSEIVVELGVGEEFSGGVVSLVELGSGFGEIAAGIAELVVKSFVGGKLSERALAGANVAHDAVAVFESGLGLIVERGIVEELADRAFLRADVGEDGVRVVYARIHFGVKLVGHEKFADSSLP